jgi:hypothetical protein
MAFITTVHTDKQGLTALLAGVLGVNQQQCNPHKLALVFQELPDLMESPTLRPKQSLATELISRSVKV